MFFRPLLNREKPIPYNHNTTAKHDYVAMIVKPNPPPFFML
jgi:hypothetical protein